METLDPPNVSSSKTPQGTSPRAAFVINATTFKEYTSPGTFCPYTIEPLDKSIPKVLDTEGQPIWRFGRKGEEDFSLHVGHYQKEETSKDEAGGELALKDRKPTTIRLEPRHGRGLVQLKIQVNGEVADFHPVGLVFLRADQTKSSGQPIKLPAPYPIGIPYTTGPNPGKNYPFENVRINQDENVVEFEMVRTRRVPPLEDHKPEPKRTTHRTYRIWIIIQQASTGRIGIIDPEGEDPNTQV